MNSIILNLIYLTLICFLINILFITVSYKLLIQFILIYFCIFIFLLYLEVNFLALSFFIVYIGAVAILFLFTVLLLGKTQNNENELKEQKFFFNFKSFVWKDFISLNSIFLFYKFNTNWANSFLLQKDSIKFTLLLSDNSNFFLKNLSNTSTMDTFDEKNWFSWNIFYNSNNFFHLIEIFLKSLNSNELKQIQIWKNENEFESLVPIIQDFYFDDVWKKNINISEFDIIVNYIDKEFNFLLWKTLDTIRGIDSYESHVVNALLDYSDYNPCSCLIWSHKDPLHYIWNLKKSPFYFISKNLKFGFLNDIYILSYNLYETYFLLFWLSGCLLLISMLTVVSLIVTPKNKNNYF